MKKIANCLLLILLLGGYTNAQRVKTLTGTVVKSAFGARWSGIVIRVGNKRYGVQTSYEPSAGDQSRGERGWQVKSVGSYEVGREVQIFYKKIDCAHAYEEGVPCWLDATQIVEVKAGVRRITPRGASISQDWGTFWNAFRAAVGKRNRRKIETLMSNSFVDSGGLLSSSSERISFLNKLSKNEWRRLDVAVRRGTVFDSGCDCRVTKGLRLEFRREDGVWRWSEAWFSGD